MARSLNAVYLERLRTFYDSPASEPTQVSGSYRHAIAHYYSLLIPEGCSVLEIGCGSGQLLASLRCQTKVGVDLSSAQLARARKTLPQATFYQQTDEQLEIPGSFDYILVSDILNFAVDVQALLSRLRRNSHPGTRLVINFPNNLWHPLFSFAETLGLRRRQPESSWLSRHDVSQLLDLTDWETVKTQPRLLWPLAAPVIATNINRWIAPFLPALCLSVFTVARPRSTHDSPALTVSVIVPARNEAGNIAAVVERTPEMGRWTELIFVEGHSSDNTWAEIQKIQAANPSRRISILRQSGKGKGNAVREGFAAATGDILMILDADLTVPPEDLPKFYEAVAVGRCDFANGSRLVYPMESAAMQFLNMVANKCFGLTFSWLLSQPVKDTLCGTKALLHSNYLKIAANRTYFGDFDPFGDFDLLFGADKLNLKIADIPVRYRDRTYGSTNIHRWRHGWLLLRMVIFAARKLKFV
jgi:SAM-dependent methyltransferase